MPARPFRRVAGPSSVWLLGIVAGLVWLSAGPACGADPEMRTTSSHDRDAFAQGRFLFQRHCQPCHGRFGEGDGELVKDWEVLPRNLRLATFKYRSTPYGKLPTDDDLMRTIRRGVSGTAMPAFGKLRSAEITAVIRYLKSLSPAWKDPALLSAPLEPSRKPDWFANEHARSSQVAFGRERYRELCAPCHGMDGAGDGPAAAGLLDGLERPVRPADLRQMLRSGPQPEDVYRTIMTGINGTPMIGFAGAIQPDEAWQLAAFVLSLRPPATVSARRRGRRHRGASHAQHLTESVQPGTAGRGH